MYEVIYLSLIIAFASCDQNTYEDSAVWRIDQKDEKGLFHHTILTLTEDSINFMMPSDDGKDVNEVTLEFDQ